MSLPMFERGRVSLLRVVGVEYKHLLGHSYYEYRLQADQAQSEAHADSLGVEVQIAVPEFILRTRESLMIMPGDLFELSLTHVQPYEVKPTGLEGFFAKIREMASKADIELVDMGGMSEEALDKLMENIKAVDRVYYEAADYDTPPDIEGLPQITIDEETWGRMTRAERVDYLRAEAYRQGQ